MDAQSPHVNPDAELHSVPTWPGTLTVLRTIGSTTLATKRWIWRTALGEWSKCSSQAGAWRNVSTTLIHPVLEFKLGSGHMAPPFVGQAGSGLPEGKIACADPG